MLCPKVWYWGCFRYLLDWRIDFFLNILYTGIESFLTGHLSFSNTRRMYMTCLKNKTKIYVHNDIILRKKCEFKKNCYIKMLVHDSIDILFVEEFWSKIEAIYIYILYISSFWNVFRNHYISKILLWLC